MALKELLEFSSSVLSVFDGIEGEVFGRWGISKIAICFGIEVGAFDDGDLVMWLYLMLSHEVFFKNSRGLLVDMWLLH